MRRGKEGCENGMYYINIQDSRLRNHYLGKEPKTVVSLDGNTDPKRSVTVEANIGWTKISVPEQKMIDEFLLKFEEIAARNNNHYGEVGRCHSLTTFKRK
jgi:hypothetical protein